MNHFDSPDFKRLREKYYRLLRKTGFKDIEDSQGRLIVPSFPATIGFKDDLFVAIRDYYTWASSMLIDTQFKKKVDRTIWRLHAEGCSSREISAKVKLEQSWICRKIKMIRKYLIENYGARS